MDIDFSKAMTIRLDDELPELHPFDPKYRRAPRRESKLTEADKELAIRNALRYVPKQHHAQMAKEFARELKEHGLWIYGTAADGASDLWHTDFTGALALVIGSEGDGMGRLVRESCDVIVSLPMRGQLSSLNASAAAAITMYEILRQRSQ